MAEVTAITGKQLVRAILVIPNVTNICEKKISKMIFCRRFIQYQDYLLTHDLSIREIHYG